MAVDQEGGQVRRLREQVGFPELPSAQTLGAGDPEGTRRAGAETAEGLLSLGFNLNLAPVVDLNLNPDSPVIGGIGRCFSADPAEVARHTAPGGTAATYTAAGFVRRGLADAGFTVERTPGYGRKRHMTKATLS